LQQENHHSSKIQEASLGMDSETANHETSIKQSQTLFFRFFFSRVVMSIAQIRESHGTASSHKQKTTKEQETQSELSS
jgi:hypothetical protein